MSSETLLSLVLSGIISALISFCVSYFFWKRPISTEFICTRMLTENKDSCDEIYYRIGYDHLGWQVEKIRPSLIELGESAKSYADKKNNPGVTTEPSTLEEVRMLNYRNIK